jgi:hypothetical protein
LSGHAKKKILNFVDLTPELHIPVSPTFINKIDIARHATLWHKLGMVPIALELQATLSIWFKDLFHEPG